MMGPLPRSIITLWRNLKSSAQQTSGRSSKNNNNTRRRTENQPWILLLRRLKKGIIFKGAGLGLIVGEHVFANFITVPPLEGRRWADVTYTHSYVLYYTYIHVYITVTIHIRSVSGKHIMFVRAHYNIAFIQNTFCLEKVKNSFPPSGSANTNRTGNIYNYTA